MPASLLCLCTSCCCTSCYPLLWFCCPPCCCCCCYCPFSCYCCPPFIHLCMKLCCVCECLFVQACIQMCLCFVCGYWACKMEEEGSSKGLITRKPSVPLCMTGILTCFACIFGRKTAKSNLLHTSISAILLRSGLQKLTAMFPSRGACLRLRGVMGTYERVLCGVGCAAAESFSPPPPPSPSCWQLQKASKASFSETAAAIATCSILSGASSSSGTGAGVDLLKREVSGTTLCERSPLIGPGCSHIEYLHNCAILLCFGHKG